MVVITSVASRIVTTGIKINAISPSGQPTITLGGVDHGARFDTQEEAYFTTTTIASTTAKLVATTESPDYDSINAEFYFENITDGTSIDTDGTTKTQTLTMASSPQAQSRTTLELDSSDYNDTIKLSTRRKDYSGTSYDNQPALFVYDFEFITNMTQTDSVSFTDTQTSKLSFTKTDSV